MHSAKQSKKKPNQNKQTKTPNMDYMGGIEESTDLSNQFQENSFIPFTALFSYRLQLYKRV